MKITLLTFALLFLSCSSLTHQKSEPVEDSLVSLLSPEELKIHQCLQKAGAEAYAIQARKSCLTGTSFEGIFDRMPASDDEIVFKNGWLFGSQSRLNQFLRVAKSFVKAQTDIAGKSLKNVTKDRGIGVYGAAYVGVGGEWMAKFMNHGGEIALYCSQGLGIKSDVGIEAGIAVIQAISCENETHDPDAGYLSIEAGISGELIGLPLDLELNYGFGINLKQLKTNIQKMKQNGRLNFTQLRREVASLSGETQFSGLDRDSRQTLIQGLKVVGLLGLGPQITATHISAAANMVRTVVKEKKSLGLRIKQKIASKPVEDFFTDRRLPNLRLFLRAFAQSLSGCDHMGGAGALGLSLSPVAVGILYEKHQEVYEMKPLNLRLVAALSPLVLLNPMLLNPNDLKLLIDTAKDVLSIPQKIRQNCGPEQYLNLRF